MSWRWRRRRGGTTGGRETVPGVSEGLRAICTRGPRSTTQANYIAQVTVRGPRSTTAAASPVAICTRGPRTTDNGPTLYSSCVRGPRATTQTASATAWEPTAEADLLLWLDPTDTGAMTKDGSDRVSQLNDKSTNADHHVQATAAAQPLYGATLLGGDPGIYFNGSTTDNERLTNAGIAFTTSTLTWGVACKLDATQLRTTGRIISFKTSDRTQEWDAPESLIALRYEASPSPRVIAERNGTYLDFGPADTDAHIYVAVMDGATIKAYTDGVFVSQINFTGALSSEHSAYGGSYQTGFNAAATLGPLVVFSGAATDTKRQVLEGYLRSKAPTATSLPVDHPWASAAPTVAGSGGVVTPPPPPTPETAVIVRARQDAVAGANAQFRFVVNSVDIGTVREVTATSAFEPVSFGIDTAVANIAKFGVRFINDSYSAGPPVLDRNLYVESVALAGTTYLSPIAVQYDSTTGQTITGALAGNMYNNGLLEWTLTSPPTSPPPPPSTGSNVLTRSGKTLTWNGQTTKLWGVNFRPCQHFDVDGPPTWTQTKQDRIVQEITNIKNSFGGNYVRVNVAPGEFRYWNDPSRNRLFPMLDAIIARALTDGMFIELNWWTVGCPDGPRADDSFFSAEYFPGYDTTFSLCKSFWTIAAARYKAQGHVIFSLWDEPIKRVASDTWTQMHPYNQELVTLIRNLGAPNPISMPGNHYSRDFTTVLTTHPIVDPTENWAMRYHEFAAGEPQNYVQFTTSGGTRVDSVRPMIIGGAGYEPVSQSAPTGLYKTWLDTYVYPEADGLAWWDGSAYNTPNLYLTGYPTNAATTYTAYGNYAKANPIAPLLRPSAATSPPTSPPPAPGAGPDPGLPTIPVFASVVDMTGQANIYVDTVAGNDSNNGSTPALAKKTFSAGWSVLGNNQTIAIKCGSVINGYTALTAKSGSRIVAYGFGSRPIFKNVREFTGGQIQSRGNGKYTISLGGLPQSTPYAAARVTHATTVSVNDGAHVCTWYARNGEGEVLGTSRTDMFWHTNGNLTFCSPVTPTKVEVGYEDSFLISGADGWTIQDVQFGPSRGHGIIVSNAEGYTIQRCEVFGTGLTGMYIQNKTNTTTDNITIQGNRCRRCHAEGIVLNWANPAGEKRNCFRNAIVRDNIVQFCCMGPPFIFSGFTSQDYYSAGIKLFTNTWESPTWDNGIEIYGNLIEDLGDQTIRYVYSGNYRYDGVNGYESNQAMGVWVDTVTGGTTAVVKIYRNTIRRTWAAGVMLEANPNAPHQVYNNVIENCGLQLTGYSGGICSCRGNSGSLIYHNTLRNNSYAGMNMQAGSGNTVTGDGRTVQENTFNVTWRDNIVISAPGVPVVREIYRSGTNNGTSYLNNLFFGSNIWQYRSNNNPWDNPTSYNSVAAWTTARGGSVSNSRTGDPLLDSQYRPRAGSDAIGRASDGKNIGAAETVTP
jgi:hypothetical protein